MDRAAPFVIPATRTVLPGGESLRMPLFVGRHDGARHGFEPIGRGLAIRFGAASVNNFESSSTPITPVEAGSTYFGSRLERLRNGFTGS